MDKIVHNIGLPGHPIRSDFFSAENSDGMTRGCIDPWQKIFIKADGKVALCCYTPPVGSIEEDNIDDIVNNEKSMAYRQGLLNGELIGNCRNCPEKPLIPINELREAVIKYQKEGKIVSY
tara:strand:+ start:108 stop:467 length:360 start_codon:yes stop_codon:yes gene_type:complete